MYQEIRNAVFEHPPEQKRVLIVEDDLTIQPVLERMIRRINPNIQIDWTTRAEKALILLSQSRDTSPRPYEVVLTDIGLAGEKSGIDLVNECYLKQISANFVLTSGNDSFTTKFPFIPKPLRFRDVEACLGPWIEEAPIPVSYAYPNQAWPLLSRAADWYRLLRGNPDQRMDWLMFVTGAVVAAYCLSRTGTGPSLTAPLFETLGKLRW